MHLSTTTPAPARRKGPISAAAGLVLLLSLVQPVGMDQSATASAAPIGEGSTSDDTTPDRTVEYEAQVREQNYLSSDLEFVKSVDADPTATTELIGVPILPEEHDEILRRKALGSNIEPIADALRPLGVYGGGWMDNSNGGQLTIAIVGSVTSAVRDAVEGVTGNVEQVVFTSAAVPEANLIDLAGKMPYSPLWAELSVQVAAPNLVTSKVDVEIASEAPEGAEGIIQKAFGPLVNVTRTDVEVVAAATRNFSSGPLYGGAWLSGGGWKCTDGYSNVRDSVGRYYTITAGHCFSRSEAPPAIDSDATTTAIVASIGEPELRGFAVNVEVALDAVTSDSGYGQAGGNLLLGGGGRCTSGFVVKQTAGPELGVLTAGHCQDTMSQIRSDGSTAFTFSFRGDEYGVGDYQWMRSPVMMDGWFHYAVGLGRAATGIGNASMNQSLCKYGDETHTTCGSVDQVYAEHTVNGVKVTGLVRTRAMANDGGDSGGPVYNGGRAYGLVKGKTVGPLIANYYYTPIATPLNKYYLHLCLDAC
jgi:hypothetical protein